MSIELVFVDGSGHIPVQWDRRSDAAMKQVVERLWGRGHRFYHLEYDEEGPTPLQTIDEFDALVKRSILVEDETLRALHEAGELKVVSGAWGKALNFVRALRSLEEVITVTLSDPPKAVEPQKKRSPSRPAAPRPIARVAVFKPMSGG